MSNKTGITVILILFSVIALFGSYKYIYKPKTQAKESIESELVTLRATRDDLEEKNKHKAEYEAEIAANYEKFYEVISEYPGNLNQDVAVMFMKGIETDKTNSKFLLDKVQLSRPELFYTLQAPANDENGNAQYDCYRVAYPIQYNGDYEGIKSIIDFVMNYKYRMNCTHLVINYDPVSEVYSGEIEFDAFSVNGAGRPDEKADVNEKEGKSNPFHDADGGNSVISGAHDSDNGDSIATSYDAKIDLNNANGDSNAGVTVTAAGSNASSKLNEVQSVDIKIEEKDGKVVASYTVEGNTFEGEITGKEFAIYVESSARVDSDDTNGIKLNIDNSTDIPVFIKVSGDDEASPRFSLGSKSGIVKVY